MEFLDGHTGVVTDKM